MREGECVKRLLDCAEISGEPTHTHDPPPVERERERERERGRDSKCVYLLRDFTVKSVLLLLLPYFVKN